MREAYNPKHILSLADSISMRMHRASVLHVYGMGLNLYELFLNVAAAFNIVLVYFIEPYTIRYTHSKM